MAVYTIWRKKQAGIQDLARKPFS